MLKKLLQKDEGFTLIEIVLVLAIAGLIMVIVFLAVVGAQRSRRDTQRKNDASRALAAMESCSSNNNGQYPAACVASLVSGGYFTGTGPGGTTYTVVNAAPTADGQLRPQSPGSCNGAAAGTASVTIWQEQGASFCVHN
jgi:prepilin-type N-terminal cleavage/methylation domain-containing protein